MLSLPPAKGVFLKLIELGNGTCGVSPQSHSRRTPCPSQRVILSESLASQKSSGRGSWRLQPEASEAPRHSYGDRTSYFSKYSTPNNNRSHPLTGGFAPDYLCPPIQLQSKKNVKWKFLKARDLQILPTCLCKLHFLLSYSFVFMCMLYLCVSTLNVEVRSQCWVSCFVFLHFVYLLTFETGSFIGPRAHQLARLHESLCLSSNSELETWLFTWVLLIQTGSSCLGSQHFLH